MNVVDATNLERNLYLTVQLLELGIPVVMALNIYDEAEAKGYRIDVRGIEERLGIRVVPTSATKKTRPRRAAREPSSPPRTPRRRTRRRRSQLRPGPRGAPRVAWRDALESAHPTLAESYPLRWLALKLIEGDAASPRRSSSTGAAARRRRSSTSQRRTARTSRRSWPRRATGSRRGSPARCWRSRRCAKTELTEKIDRVVLNRFLGIPIFLAAMWLVFKLTFDLSAPFGDWIDAMTSGPFKRWAAALLGRSRRRTGRCRS